MRNESPSADGSYPPFEIDTVTIDHRQMTIHSPVKTAFGTMTHRHLVVLKIEDDEGRVGLGESWVNFPAWAPWERTAAFEKVFIPFLMANRTVPDIPTYIKKMFRALLGPAVQSGTVGPLLQGVCAVEAGLWDLLARRQGLSLCQLLFETPRSTVQVYASGINGPLPLKRIADHLDKGVTLFKLKLGFGDEQDLENLKGMKTLLGDNAQLAVDTNRGWTFEQAVRWLPILAENDIVWLEEPLAVNHESRLDELRWLSEVPIAGGENVMTPPAIDVQELLQRPFDVWQPDVTKYTPLHVAVDLIRAVQGEKSPTIVPHFLGSGPGQALSLQLAAGCSRGLVELDINPNPLRTDVLAHPFEIVDGSIAIPERPGIGWTLGDAEGKK